MVSSPSAATCDTTHAPTSGEAGARARAVGRLAGEDLGERVVAVGEGQGELLAHRRGLDAAETDAGPLVGALGVAAGVVGAAAPCRGRRAVGGRRAERARPAPAASASATRRRRSLAASGERTSTPGLELSDEGRRAATGSAGPGARRGPAGSTARASRPRR